MRNRSHTAAVEGIRAWVGDKLGLQFEHERTQMLRQRLTLVCRKLKLSMCDLQTRLEAGDRALAISIAEEVSTNHTLFLREPEMFELLGRVIFPSLPAAGPLRIWSAACSSGEEAYTIAMSACDAFGVAAARERIRILGTDISERQVRHAERGVFERVGVAGNAPALMRYFVGGVDGGADLKPSQVRVRGDVAGLCTFRRFNLTQDGWPFEHKFHVVFLRNVLYYFDPAMRQRVLERCFEVSTPDAWLITSVTEPMIGTRSPWSQLAPGVFRKPNARAIDLQDSLRGGG
jgi:chemotaxis protein methyltransferase CheR